MITFSRRWSMPVKGMLALLTLLVVGGGHLRAADADKNQPRRLFWVIHTPSADMYFLGSVHVSSKEMYPLPPEIEAAYAKAGALVVEADVTRISQAQLQEQVLDQGMYADGDTLDKHIAPATMTAFRKFCDEAGMPAMLFANMKPVMAAVMVEGVAIEKLGLSADDGIDMHFLEKANSAKDKKIVELESADVQLKLLFGLGDKLAEKWLSDSLKDSAKEELEKTIKLWREGDDQQLSAMIFDSDKKDPDAAKLSDILLYQRNDAMVKKLEPMLKEKQSVFVVVGAGHLLGDKGILAQLKAKGYAVDRPPLTAATVAPASAPASAPATAP